MKILSTMKSMMLLFAMLAVSTSVLAQTPVTTTGGTAENIPKFNGPFSITNSTLREAGPYLEIGNPGTTSGFVETSGTVNAFSFLKRTLTSWPTTWVAGDAFAWYNPDGSARLWTYEIGDVFTVKSNGEVALAGPIRFPDNTTQSTATLQGPAGPQGPQGPPGPAVNTSAACTNAMGGSCEYVCAPGRIVAQTGGNCTVTSDTGSCSATALCCVCAP